MFSLNTSSTAAISFSPNIANTFSNLCTLIAEHGIRISLAWVSVSAPSWATNVSYPALTSVLSRSGTCGFFSLICRSMYASGKVAYTPSRYTVLLSCLSTKSCTIMCSVTADCAQPTCPKSLFIAIDKLRSPVFLLGYSWPLEPSSCNANVPYSSWSVSLYL